MSFARLDPQLRVRVGLRPFDVMPELLEVGDNGSCRLPGRVIRVDLVVYEQNRKRGKFPLHDVPLPIDGARIERTFLAEILREVDPQLYKRVLQFAVAVEA